MFYNSKRKGRMRNRPCFRIRSIGHDTKTREEKEGMRSRRLRSGHDIRDAS